MAGDALGGDPVALSWNLASLHVSFGFALIGATVGEFLGAKKRMGLLIATAQGTFDANGVFTAMIVVAVVALVAEGVLTLLRNRLLVRRPEPSRGVSESASAHGRTHLPTEAILIIMPLRAGRVPARPACRIR